jgi:hypothetical protein
MATSPREQGFADANGNFIMDGPDVVGVRSTPAGWALITLAGRGSAAASRPGVSSSSAPTGDGSSVPASGSVPAS